MSLISEKIRNASKEDLLNPQKLHRLILDIGFSDKRLDQHPKHLRRYCNPEGPWQNPRQLTKLLLFLSQFKIKSYLEIGVFRCGTFSIITEFLDKLYGLDYALGIDPKEYKEQASYIDNLDNKNIEIRNWSSKDNDFLSHIEYKTFDLALIDGNHGLDGVLLDFSTVKKRTSIILFHDVCSVCEDSWERIRTKNQDNYDIYEIKDQYKRVSKPYFGFGILVKRG